jgi:Protein of unknown function (DUF3306)
VRDPEGFLARWSRRKREVAADAVEVRDHVRLERVAEREGAATQGKRDACDNHGDAADPTKPGFDPASLPAIGSITAETDIRAFLAPGVPAELTSAALRRVWVSDPSIRDFVGLADYAWDFNARGSMAGFGPLETTDAVHRQMAQLIGRGGAEDGDGVISDPKDTGAELGSSPSAPEEPGRNADQPRNDELTH